jgi:hypothetical protein
MKLAAIYNVWDGDELLKGSIKCLYYHVDEIIVVYQNVSNFGEKYHPQIMNTVTDRAHFIRYDPKVGQGGPNEIAKRNIGLDKARFLGCTHFMHVDCDEYYRDFPEAKFAYINSGHAGSVLRLHTYFKHPTLRLDQPENYYVPFIHKLEKDTIAGDKFYPYYVDPTRRINQKDVVELPFWMHHYSWVRKDIGRKVRNSTARKTIQGKHYLDYQRDLRPGDYLPCYDRKLIQVPDYFNITSVL